MMSLSSRSSNVLGVTLVEMLVTIALLVIVATIAVPNFSQLIQNNRSNSQAHLFFQSIQYARTEAVRTNSLISISPHNNGWCVHSTASCTPASALREIADATQLVKSSFTVMTFDGRGRRKLPAGNNITTYFQPQNCNAENARLVEISALGLPSLRKGQCI